MSYGPFRGTEPDILKQLKEQFKEDVTTLTSDDIKGRRPVYLESDNICGIEATEAVMTRLENASRKLQSVRIPISVDRDPDGGLRLSVPDGQDIQVDSDFVVPIARSNLFDTRRYRNHYDPPKEALEPGPPTLASCSVILGDRVSIDEKVLSEPKFTEYLRDFAKKNGSELPSFFLRIERDEGAVLGTGHDNRASTRMKTLLTGLFRSRVADTDTFLNVFRAERCVTLWTREMSRHLGMSYSIPWTHAMKYSLVSEDETFSIITERFPMTRFCLRAVVQESREMLTAERVWAGVLARRRERETDA